MPELGTPSRAFKPLSSMPGERQVKTKDLFGGGDDLGDTGENFAVGGANRWKYGSFVNWEFFPSADLPILVYFKETQAHRYQRSETRHSILRSKYRPWDIETLGHLGHVDNADMVHLLRSEIL